VTTSKQLVPAVRYVVIANVAASFLIAGGKVTAFGLTGSAGMFADAAESLVHTAASLFAAFSVWYAARPADLTHPYGHGRIVYLAVGVEGVLILVASASAIGCALVNLFTDAVVHNIDAGLAIGTGLVAVNLVLAAVLARVGHRNQQTVLVANSRHIMADVATTSAAVVGVALVKLTGVAWIDPAAGIVIGVVILASGISLIRQSLAGILDRLDPDLADRLRTHLLAAREHGEILSFHQLRCRVLDRELWVEVHLVVDGTISVRMAHDRVTALEARIAADLTDHVVRFATHIEPPGHHQAHPDGHEPAVDPLMDSDLRNALDGSR